MALAHRPVLRAPYSITLTEKAKEKMSAYLGDDSFANEPIGDIVNSPVIRIEYGVRDADGLYTDEFGINGTAAKIGYWTAKAVYHP